MSEYEFQYTSHIAGEKSGDKSLIAISPVCTDNVRTIKSLTDAQTSVLVGQVRGR